MACEDCSTPGKPSCAVVDVAEVPLPCTGCGEQTRARTVCGAARHHLCQRPVPTGVPIVAPAPGFAEWARGQFPDADIREIRRAEALWANNMRNIAFHGPTITARNILNGALAHHKIPALPEMPANAFAPMRNGKRWIARTWVTTRNAAMARPGADIVAYDVNGQYLSAASIELGTGTPLHLTPDGLPGTLAEVFRRPGYTRLARVPDPWDADPYNIRTMLEPGMWLPHPLAGYLIERGATITPAESLVFMESRRWLRPHADLLRDARAACMGLETPAARIALAAIKGVYTRMFGGLLRSAKHNGEGRTLRPDWADMIVSTGQARMFRALDKTGQGCPNHGADSLCPDCAAGGRYAHRSEVVAIHVDAAWFYHDGGSKHPTGLEISTQLGKWKYAGRTPATDSTWGALVSGDWHTVRGRII